MNQAVGILAGIAAASVPAFSTGYLLKKKNKAETTYIITQASELVINQLTGEIKKLNQKNDLLTSRVRQLEQQVIDLGGNPWKGRRR